MGACTNLLKSNQKSFRLIQQFGWSGLTSSWDNGFRIVMADERKCEHFELFPNYLKMYLVFER